MTEYRQATAHVAALEEHVALLQQSGNIERAALDHSLSSILVRSGGSFVRGINCHTYSEANLFCFSHGGLLTVILCP